MADNRSPDQAEGIDYGPTAKYRITCDVMKVDLRRKVRGDVVVLPREHGERLIAFGSVEPVDEDRSEDADNTRETKSAGSSDTGGASQESTGSAATDTGAQSDAGDTSAAGDTSGDSGSDQSDATPPVTAPARSSGRAARRS